MPRDGSGTFTRTDGVQIGSTVWQQADAAGVNIEAPDHDTHDQDIAQALTDSLAKDGQTVATGDLQMGNNEITGMADGSANTSAATVRQIQNQSGSYGTDVGVANAYNVSVSPSLGAYATGVVIRFEPANSNTGASTITVSGLAVRDIQTADGKALVGGELLAGRQVEIIDDGTAFRLQGAQSSIVLVEDDAGAGEGPMLDLKRDSASPAVSDQLGAINFYGNDDGGNETLYGAIVGQIVDQAGGAEDGAIRFELSDNGAASALKMIISNTETQFADGASDAGAGPQLSLRRTSGSPADNDLGGRITNAMNNSAAERVEFGTITGQALDVTDATEDGAWIFETMQGGTLTEILKLSDTVEVTGNVAVNGQSDFTGQTTIIGETICRRTDGNPVWWIA